MITRAQAVQEIADCRLPIADCKTFSIRNSQFAIRNFWGFTLIEMLFVVSIFGVIMGALLISFLVGKSSYLSADAYVQVQQEARRAFDNMVKELREAGGTITPADAASPSLTFQVALGYNLTTLCAGAGDCCPANAVCYGAPDQSRANQYKWSVRYCAGSLAGGCAPAGTQLLRQILNAAGAVQPGTRVLANDVNGPALSFLYTSGTRTVTAQLQVQQTSQQLPGGSMSTTPAPLQTRVRLRNN